MRKHHTRLPLVAAILVCVMMPWPAPASADVIVREQTKYFPVDGSNGFELSRSMLDGGRKRINMRHAIAATESSYSIGEADIAIKRGRCVVESIDVRVDLTYHFPRWTRQSQASAKLRRAWDQFYVELVRHEKQHGAIAKQGAAELERLLKRTSGTVAFGCNDFGAFAAMRLEAAARRIEQRQRAFDRRENFSSSKISRLQVRLFDAQ
jgi:predicted secreted Zn-dependent protease